MLKRICVLVTLLVPLGMLASAQVAASRRVALGDWPEMRGPHRNGVSDEKGLDREVGAQWAELPLARPLWRPLGARSSWATASTSRTRPGVERRCRNASWRSTPTPARWSGNTSSASSRATCRRTASAGPRRPSIPKPATSTRWASDAELIALSKDGKRLWSRSIGEEFAAFTTHGGRTMSPTIDGDLVIVSAAISSWGTQANRAAPLHRARQAHGRHRLGLEPGRPSLRHGVRGAADRHDQRPAPAHLRHAATARIYAIKPQTGEKVWGFVAAKRAINTGVVVSGTTVIVSHGDENLDTSELGMIGAIDGSQTGDIKTTKWAHKGDQFGFSSPGDRRHARLSGGERIATQGVRPRDPGKPLWTQTLGTIQKAPLVLADGKLYVGTESGKFFIVRPAGRSRGDPQRRRAAAEQGRQRRAVGRASGGRFRGRGGIARAHLLRVDGRRVRDRTRRRRQARRAWRSTSRWNRDRATRRACRSRRPSSC